MRTNLTTKAMNRIVFLRLRDVSLPEIADQLAREGFKTASGGAWYPSTIQMYLRQVSKALVAPSRIGAPRRPRKLRRAA
jgi:Recombinase